MGVTKLYPGWKEAAFRIVARVETEGYGVVINFETLHALLDLQKPSEATFAEFQKYSFDLLQNVENLKTFLLEEHNLCLHNVRGVGYQVLHPDDQVTLAATRLFRKAMGMVRKAIEVLTHIDMDALSSEGKEAQLRQLTKAAFLRSAMRDKKQIGSKKEPKKLPEPEDGPEGGSEGGPEPEISGAKKVNHSK